MIALTLAAMCGTAVVGRIAARYSHPPETAMSAFLLAIALIVEVATRG